MEQVARSKPAGWERLGLAVEFRTCRPTDQPAASLTLSGPDRTGDLTFWVSGETELAYGSSPRDVVQRHEDGVTVERIGALMDELASRVDASGAPTDSRVGCSLRSGWGEPVGDGAGPDDGHADGEAVDAGAQSRGSVKVVVSR